MSQANLTHNDSTVAQIKDELQQRVNLLAITFSAVLTGFLTFSYGFLENIGFPKLPTFAIFPMLFVLWGIGLGYFTRRY